MTMGRFNGLLGAESVSTPIYPGVEPRAGWLSWEELQPDMKIRVQYREGRSTVVVEPAFVVRVSATTLLFKYWGVTGFSQSGRPVRGWIPQRVARDHLERVQVMW